LRTYAYAKINLGLRILGARADGYHEIETLFQQIDLCDILDFSPADSGIHLQVVPPICPADERNLVIKSAQLLELKTGRKLGCCIKLQKVIPPGSGLGGGSSDAAATLKTLNSLFGVGLGEPELLQVAAELGSDVPFFIRGGTALGMGRGEKLEPWPPSPPYHGVLLLPDFEVSSGWAYSMVNFSLTKYKKRSKFRGFAVHYNDFRRWKQFFNNDLEHIVLKNFPDLRALRDRLLSMGAFYASMSGSGSSIFGLFEDEEAAQNAFKALRESVKAVYFRPI